VLVTGLLLNVWSATAAESKRREAGLPAVQQMVVHCTALQLCTTVVAAERTVSSAGQEQQLAEVIAALQLSCQLSELLGQRQQQLLSTGAGRWHGITANLVKCSHLSAAGASLSSAAREQQQSADGNAALELS
jgi:hypothetical protein